MEETKDEGYCIGSHGRWNRESIWGGIKQLEPVGPNGEIIMDYSIHDALEAGCNKVVFIIRRDIEQDFKNIIGKRIEKLVPVEYVYQSVNELPANKENIWNRTKPWGTGQAVLCVKNVVKEPFIVINADDYYGKDAFQNLYQYMTQKMNPESQYMIYVWQVLFWKIH